MNTSVSINETTYGSLLSKTRPRVIDNEEENERYTRALEELLLKDTCTPEEDELKKLLILLIERFEEEHSSLAPSSPLDVVRFLMESNGLRQVDLLDVFGTASIASEVLSAKRELTKSHIQKLSERFHVSPAVFFEQETA